MKNKEILKYFFENRLLFDKLDRPPAPEAEPQRKEGGEIDKLEKELKDALTKADDLEKVLLEKQDVIINFLSVTTDHELLKFFANYHFDKDPDKYPLGYVAEAVASNPNLTDDIVWDLLRNENIAVVGTVVVNKNIRMTLKMMKYVIGLGRKGYDAITDLGRRKDTPVEILKMIADDPNLSLSQKGGLLFNPKTPEGIRRYLFLAEGPEYDNEEENPRIKCALLTEYYGFPFSNIPKDVLEIFLNAEGDDAWLKNVVIDCRGVPEEILIQLSQDPDPEVSDAAIRKLEKKPPKPKHKAHK